MNKELEVNERRLVEAQKIAHFGSWEYDIETDKLHWSEELYKIFRQDSKTYIPSFNEYMNYIHPDNVQSMKEAIANVKRGDSYIRPLRKIV